MLAVHQPIGQGLHLLEQVQQYPWVQFSLGESVAESGEPVLVKNHTRFKQGNIEVTNIDMLNEVNAILRLNASMLASMQMIKLADSMYNKAINIREA